MAEYDPIPAPHRLTRRRFLRTSAAAGSFLAAHALLPAWARPGGDPGRRRPGEPIDLTLRRRALAFGGRTGRPITLNGTVPGPLLRLYEGEDLVIRVHNELDEDSSIHWHGLLLPFRMDGVPGVSFPGIPAGETFTYRYPVRQHGTYWYHSHTRLQEQLGHYGPIVIVPEGGEAHASDREHVVVLSDWTFESPYRVLAKLKKAGDYYNFQKRTVEDLAEDIGADGLGPTLRDRWAWGRMRMSPTDIADVTGATYTYLMNGLAPGDNWTGLFRPGERVRLRLVNASTGTFFNVRLPGLPMTVVQADGQDVRPVEVDELQMGVAETYDVIVQPPEDRAYTLFAESMDRSGFARGTLAPREGLEAPVPELRPPPRRTMVDMGMEMDMGAGDGASDHGADGPGRDGGHGASGHGGEGSGAAAPVPGVDPVHSPVVARHGPDGHGPGNVSVATVQRSRLGEPGTGLGDVGHRVLVYTDLVRLADDFDARPPDREVELHLTGNMERFVWGIDGRKYSESVPVELNYGERLRLVLVNDTMMEHPMHLHGMWMELENGKGRHIPRKHTIVVKPAERVSALITVDAPGRWAFHCHLLYHMEAGMFRVFRVS